MPIIQTSAALMVDGVALLVDSLPVMVTTAISVTEEYPLAGLSQSFPVTGPQGFQITTQQAFALDAPQSFPVTGQQAPMLSAQQSFSLAGQTQYFPLG